MAGYENAFQAMDETIADCCLRELPWEFSANMWRDCGDMNSRQRITEVYRIGRPLILKILSMDKSPMKNKKKISICRSMMNAAAGKMEARSPYEALSAYNKAVVFAPNVEDHLSRACSDRAACLLEIGDPEAALQDIEAALKIDDYPFEKRFELEERRGHCYVGIKQFEKAKKSFMTAISLLDDAAGFLHRKFVERKMAELQASLNSVMFLHDESNNNQWSKKKIPELRSRNSQHPAISSKVDMFAGQNNGATEILANNDIGAGEIIGVEKPFVSFLEKDYIKTNCWNCLVTIKAPFACPLCSAVKFCSKSCLDEALTSYHPSECLLTDLLICNKIGSWSLAYRAISAKPLKYHLANRHNNGLSAHSDDLTRLLRNKFPRPSQFSQEEEKKKTIMVVFYLILLQMTGYFDSKDQNGKINPSMSSIYQMKGKENDATLSEEELYIATLLMKIIDVTPYCTTDVCHFEMSSMNDWNTGKVTPVIGKTINLTLATVPHSCYPSAARICYENTTVLVSQKNIKPGERITINYAAPFYAASLADRTQYLHDGFFFRCECDACRYDWPLFDLLPTGPSGLLDIDIDINGFKSVDVNSNIINSCNNVSSMSARCSKLDQQQNLVETFSRVRSKIEQLQSLRTSGGPPSKIMIQNQVRLYRCLLAMYSSKLHTIKTGSGSLPIPL